MLTGKITVLLTVIFAFASQGFGHARGGNDDATPAASIPEKCWEARDEGADTGVIVTQVRSENTKRHQYEESHWFLGAPAHGSERTFMAYCRDAGTTLSVPDAQLSKRLMQNARAQGFTESEIAQWHMSAPAIELISEIPYPPSCAPYVTTLTYHAMRPIPGGKTIAQRCRELRACEPRLQDPYQTITLGEWTERYGCR